MSKKKIVLGLILLALSIHFGNLLMDAGVFYRSKTTQVECDSIKGIPGPEDIVYSKILSKLFVSSNLIPDGGKISDINGAIFTVDPKTALLTQVTGNLPFEFHPHGLDLWEDDSGTFVYVVSHRQDKSVIEVFKWKDEKLIHDKTIQDEMIITPNDILLLEKDMFYLSHDHGSKNPLFVKLEDYSRLGQGKVTYYASGIFTEVASSINFANGLAMDEEKGIVYLASMLSKVIYVFKIKDNYTLEEMKKIPLDVAPDNLTIGSKGEILVGAHPKLFSLKSHMEDHDNKSPFEVLQISDPLGKAEVTTIIANDGSMASGVSVALELDNYLYLGNIFQNHMLRCKR